MIKRILKIDNFGIFSGFDWNLSVRDKGNNISDFKRLNIIYGRNYSGKTTLSRIVRTIEKGHLPQKYKGANFEILTENSHIKSEEIKDSNIIYKVYNKDFVDENLSFLRDDSGDISSFAILGEKNISLEKSIEEKEAKLGKVDDNVGLLSNLRNKEIEYNNKKINLSQKENEIESKLKEKANQEIKPNKVYGNINYNIRNIKEDIIFLNSNPTETFPLDDSNIESFTKSIKDEAKPVINSLPNFTSKLIDFSSKVNLLLSKKIRPTNSLQELISDSILQNWVHEGLMLHKNKRENCAFCGSNIKDDLWNKLDSHFNQESEDIRNSLNSLKQQIITSKTSVESLLSLSSNQFYSSFHDDFSSCKDRLESLVKSYNSFIDEMNELLDKKLNNIFDDILYTPIKNDIPINKIINEINVLVNKNNLKSKTLFAEQSELRNKLRLNEVYKFIKAFDYNKKKLEIEKIESEKKACQKEIDLIKIEIGNLENDIQELNNNLKDERKGAEKVNEYLNHFFGHDSLKLIAIETENNFKFRIMRGNEPAFNLSEGECSLVAFCYFMANLENSDSIGKELSIWIDDPISSLDSNHVFFVYSLIENVLAKPIKKQDGSHDYKYKQLFISTHNLDFLKYLKRLSPPKKKVTSDSGKISTTEDISHFILERTNNTSCIRVMPDYMKKFVTEFNYLFQQIYKCANENNHEREPDCFYNFGNNLRKFLEAYLFYKYPVYESEPLNKLRKFFGDDATSTALVNRVANELSHLEEIFDRSMMPIDVPEIPKLANYVINKIRESDPDQYNALLKSIGAN